MQEQIKLLKNILGKEVESIICSDLINRPFSKGDISFIIHQKIALHLNGNGPHRTLHEYTLEGKIAKLKNHKNQNKFQLQEESILLNLNQTVQQYKSKYKSFLNTKGFMVDTIYLFEESEELKFINEVKEANYLPSCIIFRDKKRNENIFMNCFKLPYEFNINKINIKFCKGDINEQEMRNDDSKLIFIKKLDKAT